MILLMENCNEISMFKNRHYVTYGVFFYAKK